MDPETYWMYAREQLRRFLDEWEGQGTPKERLYRGWTYGPSTVMPRYLPDWLRRRFEKLWEAFDSVPPDPEHAEDEVRGQTLHSTIAAMSEDGVLALAAEIEDLYRTLEERERR